MPAETERLESRTCSRILCSSFSCMARSAPQICRVQHTAQLFGTDLRNGIPSADYRMGSSGPLTPTESVSASGRMRPVVSDALSLPAAAFASVTEDVLAGCVSDEGAVVGATSTFGPLGSALLPPPQPKRVAANAVATNGFNQVLRMALPPRTE